MAEAKKLIASMEANLVDLRLFVETAEQVNITDRVKTFDDALKIYINKVGPISSTHKSLLEYSGTDKEMLAAQAFAQMSIIRTVLNEGWTPDWTNSGQYKYYPWFDMSSGSGLSCDDYVAIARVRMSAPAFA